LVILDQSDGLTYTLSDIYYAPFPMII